MYFYPKYKLCHVLVNVDIYGFFLLLSGKNILQWNENKTKSTKMTQWRLLVHCSDRDCTFLINLFKVLHDRDVLLVSVDDRNIDAVVIAALADGGVCDDGGGGGQQSCRKCL